MKKEIVLALVVTALAAIVMLAVVRWFAPQLLGIRSDMQVVRVSEEVVPFFENVFRREDYKTNEFILKDPYTRVRARPLFNDLERLGPNDILGFRNRGVPNVADLVVIGDSQTYGNNASFEENFPSVLKRLVRRGTPTVYSMAVGGWAAVQYLNMAQHATVLQPRIIIVAFYSGNDPIESFLMAYSVDRWAGLRPDPSLGVGDVPPSPGFPPPASDLWSATLKDKRVITFSPKHRYVSNRRDHPAVRAGYEVMRRSAKNIVQVARASGAKVIFTVIPTKELAFAERLRRDGLALNPDYQNLIDGERLYIEELARALQSMDGAMYVDLLRPLQEAALATNTSIYPDSADGHPLPAGYQVIAQALAPAVEELLPKPPKGLVAMDLGGGRFTLFLVRGQEYWDFASAEIVQSNGWSQGNVPRVSRRDLDGLSYRGLITRSDPRRYGPNAVGP